jgi:hypothetical protein
MTPVGLGRRSHAAAACRCHYPSLQSFDAPANGAVSLQSDDIGARPCTERRQSGIRQLAILQPWHPAGATEYGEIEY